MKPNVLQRCLGDLDDFIENTWSRRALLQRGAGEGSFDDLLSLANVDEILTDRLLRYPDVRLIRDGKPLDVQAYNYMEKQDVGPAYLVPDLQAIYDEFARGATILLQGVHRYWPPLRALCREAEAVFGFPVQCNVFVTPGGAQGLATHIDLYESVVLHTYGTKHWTVYEPTVPFPIGNTGARVGESELGEPIMEPELRPGDSLYVPRGFPHKAATSGSASVHATLLIYGRSWVEAFSQLLGSWTETEVAFREWLPPRLVTGSTGLGAVVASKLAALSRFVAALDPDKVAQWISEEFAVGKATSGSSSITGLMGLDHIADETLVAPRPELAYELQAEGDEILLVLPERRIQMPQWVEPALQRVLGTDRMRVGALDAFLDADSRKVFVRRLIREGVLVAVAAERPRAGRDVGHDGPA